MFLQKDSYFLFIFDNENQGNIPIFVKWILIISLCLFNTSILLLLLSMRLMRGMKFDLEKIITKIHKEELNKARKRLIGNLIQLTKAMTVTNDNKVKWIYFETLFFFGLVSMIVGIIGAIFFV
ncbi:MAG: hypothetical protein JW891_01925 [Candidatus Lokiarchaeota archaeon]|nr:hypothetical protein [Candidatus Lokiarchaeota archaeon]